MRQCALSVKKNSLSYCRPPGRLDPHPADLACSRLELTALEFRHYLHHVMRLLAPTNKKGVMVVDRSGIPRVHKLASPLEHDTDKFALHFLPAHCGHHLNPIDGFWRRMKQVIGAGRGVADLHHLYQRTRQVFRVHQERPIYEFSW